MTAASSYTRASPRPDTVPRLADYPSSAAATAQSPFRRARVLQCAPRRSDGRCDDHGAFSVSYEACRNLRAWSDCRFALVPTAATAAVSAYHRLHQSSSSIDW